MAILSGLNLEMSFGENLLFTDADFEIQSNDIIGLVGANGVGKTTLFKIITGEIAPDKGGISKNSGLTIGCLDQHTCADSDKTALEEVLTVFKSLIELENEIEDITKRLDFDHSRELIEQHLKLSEKFQADGGLTYLSRAKSALAALGFSIEETTLPVKALSGGQKSKIGLARLLLSSPDLMLLDEPTNHLDIESVEWLEDYISGMNSAAVIVSHDRYFLDRIANRTFEFENRSLRYSDGNYSRYLEIKAERMLSVERNYENTMKEIRRIEGIITQQRQWNRERNIRTAESKQKQIDRLKSDLEIPEQDLEGISFKFSVSKTGGNDVLYCKDLSMKFDDFTLYENVSIDIKRANRVFLLGPNGCGKTTLLKQILSKPENVTFGAGVSIGYFDQLQSTLSPANTVIDELWNAHTDMTQTLIRNALAVFLFKGDDVYKKISDLSGGERARVAICKLMLSGANLLLLDEPTNHLDLYSREALEKALSNYPGSLLIVSHDRYFINKLADTIVYLDKSGTETVSGNYDDFIALKQDSDTAKPKEKKEMGEGGKQYKEKKRMESEIRRLKGQIKRCEEKLSEIDDEISSLNSKLEDPEISSDYQKTLEITGKIDELNSQADSLLEEWDECTNSLSELED